MPKTLTEFKSLLPESIPESTKILILGLAEGMIMSAYYAGSNISNYNTGMELEFKYPTWDSYKETIS